MLVVTGNGVELHAEELLVDVKDRRNDFVDGEVLLDLLVIESKLALSPETVVVAEVPEVELVVRSVALLLVHLLLEFEEVLLLRLAERGKLGLEVLEEGHDRLRVLGHLDLSVSPAMLVALTSRM